MTSSRPSATQRCKFGSPELGALSKAQEERSKIFQTLVKEGEVVQKRTQKIAGDRIEQVRAAAGESWAKFEHAYGAQMTRVLHTWGVPTKKEFDALSRRVAELAATAKRPSKRIKRPR